MKLGRLHQRETPLRKDYSNDDHSNRYAQGTRPDGFCPRRQPDLPRRLPGRGKGGIHPRCALSPVSLRHRRRTHLQGKLLPPRLPERDRRHSLHWRGGRSPRRPRLRVPVLLASPLRHSRRVQPDEGSGDHRVDERREQPPHAPDQRNHVPGRVALQEHGQARRRHHQGSGRANDSVPADRASRAALGIPGNARAPDAARHRPVRRGDQAAQERLPDGRRHVKCSSTTRPGATN